MASAASMLALKKPSSVPFRTGFPRISPMRCNRLASPRKTKNTGAFAIQGMLGNNFPIAARFAVSRSRRIEACWKSDFADALSAAATKRSSRLSSGTLSL